MRQQRQRKSISSGCKSQCKSRREETHVGGGERMLPGHFGQCNSAVRMGRKRAWTLKNYVSP